MTTQAGVGFLALHRVVVGAEARADWSGDVSSDLVDVFLLSLVALRTGRDQPFQQRRREKKEAKPEARREAGKPTESLPLRLLGKGDPKLAFVGTRVATVGDLRVINGPIEWVS
jgi:hypothetical protein